MFVYELAVGVPRVYKRKQNFKLRQVTTPPKEWTKFDLCSEMLLRTFPEHSHELYDFFFANIFQIHSLRHTWIYSKSNNLVRENK